MNFARSKADEWYYVETDTLFFYSSNIEEYKKQITINGITGEIEKIGAGIFFAKRKYVIGNLLLTKGFKRK